MSDEEEPQLSKEAFSALQEFYKEQEENRLNSLNSSVFAEDWQLSQFWYDDNTVEALVKLSLCAVGPEAKIALISCPTLYKKLNENIGAKGRVKLYEYDSRFAVFGNDFIHYDYKSPLNIPRHNERYYDLVIADPPFLSEECLTKTALTIKFLAKCKIILCTGELMGNFAAQLLNVQKTSLQPQHKNNLANTFCCYTNFSINQGS